jgi:hypothetical protein
MPNPTKIPPETYAQTKGGMAMKAVVALSRYVKRRIDVAKEAMTM